MAQRAVLEQHLPKELGAGVLQLATFHLQALQGVVALQRADYVAGCLKVQIVAIQSQDLQGFCSAQALSERKGKTRTNLRKIESKEF